MALTKYKEGSFRELCSIAMPLMLSSLSMMTMLFVDRLLLAHYSTEAFNAAVSATTLGWTFLLGWLILTSISEVFVAQNNGAGKTKSLGEPVWQMIWLAMGSFLFFIPFSLWGGELIYGTSPATELERQCLRWMMLFGPSFPLYAALCGFFVGQGKVRIITYLAILANVLNVILDFLLIFGVEGWIPSLGVTGAAIATCTGEMFQVIVLAVIFLRKKNRETYGTGNYQFRMQSFRQCMKIGFPGALFAVIEMLGWSAYYALMTLAGENYILIAGVSQSFAILLYFFAEGVNKAATTIAGNMIGAKNSHLISQMLINGVRLNIIFFLVMLVVLMLMSSLIISQFLVDVSLERQEYLYSPMVTSLTCILFYMLFEGIRMLLAGILTAAGDTKFLLLGGSIPIWLLLVAPVYFFVVQGHAPLQASGFICILYSFVSCLLYLWRFYEGKWKEITITA